MRNSHPCPGSGDKFWERTAPKNVLIDLMVDVLDALETAGHPEFEAADHDPALRDDATDEQRRAFLAIYGPLTNVLA
jgi:hypothetical protein